MTVSYNTLVVQQQRTGWLCPKCGGRPRPACRHMPGASAGGVRPPDVADDRTAVVLPAWDSASGAAVAANQLSGLTVNSITIIARIKLDAAELDALDFMAARQRQNRDDFVQGIVRRAILKSVMTEPLPPLSNPTDNTGAA